ncbi:phage integrase SAM-like domain-containing protein [Gracilimonas sediminicola]|uniref:phage integrase SAM-like domain-containing protein n=1 Tax=Gracilimonas sediminicola TaxID=2952158 RepID=UPI0038D42D87
MYKDINITFTIRKSKKRSDNTVPIYLRINVEGDIKEVSTGQTILPEKWDSNSTKAIGRGRLINQINQKLDTLVYKVREAHHQLLLEGAEVSAQAVKARLLGKDKEQDLPTVMEVFELHNSTMKKQVGNKYSISTLKKYRTCKKHMEAYLKEYHSNLAYPVAEIDLSFLEDFVEYLMTKDEPCANNSARKYLSNFQKVVNIARRKKWLNSNPYENFRMKYKQRKTTFLSLEEVIKIHSKQFDIERLTRVKDMFIFSCFTGFSYSDVQRLRKEDVHSDLDGGHFVQQRRVKTGQTARVPLLPIPLSIIRKYAFTSETNKGNLLPEISNQKTNAYLKEIADVCGIKKRLTFHVARHTCATVLLNLDMHIETVQHILGHADLKTTQHYAKLSQSKINSDMERVQKALSERIGND